MRITIIVFSPTGNTRTVATMIERELGVRGARVQLLDITANRDYFQTGISGKKQFLREMIKPHDLLLLGGPVYVGELHYNMRKLISLLPPPGNGWADIAVPFVTFGHVTSGRALRDAAREFRKSGRKTVCAMKINSFHCFTRRFSKKINEGMPGDEALPVIRELSDRIFSLNRGKTEASDEIISELNYQNIRTRMKQIIFN